MKAPGEELLAKLWDTIADKGIASLFKPWQMRREGRASIELKCQELVAIAQAEQYAEQIRKGEKTVNLNLSLPLNAPSAQNEKEKIEPYLDLNSLTRINNTTENAEFLRKEINITKALLHAEAVLEQNNSPAPEENIDGDWLLRWRDNASQVSSDELQSLWGNLLAGEIQSPGNYSLRTLDFLKNISQAEAKKIELLSQFVLSGMIPRSLESELENNGITFGFLLEMQELGILTGVGAAGLTFTVNSSQPDSFLAIFTSNGKCLVIQHHDKSKNLSIPIYQVTLIGKQILSLGSFLPNTNFLYGIGKTIATQGFDVELANYHELGNNKITYFSPEKIHL